MLALILRGIFLCRQCDFDWLYKNGARRVFPDLWEEFVNHIPLSERGDLLKAYYERLTGDDELARMVAAKYWSAWKGAALSCDQAQKHWQVLPSSKMP